MNSETYESVNGMGRDALVQFVLFNVSEYGEVDAFLPDNVALDNPKDVFRAKNVENIEWIDDGTTVVIHGIATVKEVVDRVRDTHWEPGYVVTKPVDVFFDAKFTFEDEGFCEGRVER